MKFIIVIFIFALSQLSLAASNDSAPPAPAVPKGLSYNGINLQFGGFLASEIVYRTNNTASDIGTAFQKSPFGNSAGWGVGEFRGTERQSRLSILAQGDYDPNTHLTGYYELDFLGTSPTSNGNESNSYTARTRNVYMTVDWESGWHLLAGQNWSLATLNSKGIMPRAEAIPPTIDAQYAVGFNWARQWQLRLTKDFDKTLWVALSLENAQTVGLGGTAAAGTGNTYQLPAGSLMSSAQSLNSAPDVIAKVAWDPGFGHYEVYNLLRDFQSRYGSSALAGQTNQQNIWTDSVGAGAIVPALPGVVDISLSGLYGKGAGRYGTSQLSDTTFASDGSLAPLNAIQALAQVTWHATPLIDVWLAYGQEHVDSNVTAGGAAGYGDAIVNDNSTCTALGGTCTALVKDVQQANVGGWWSFYKGSFGVAKLGLQYSHTMLTTFADKLGLAPSTTQDMAYTSLRYYPF